MFRKPDLQAIIIPGILFGILYPALFLWAMGYLEPALPSGLKGGYLACTLLFLGAPVLLLMTGFVSENLILRKSRTGWVPFIPYCAGFLGVFLACNLMMTISSAHQYVPYMEPGLMPRLAFVTGYLIAILPGVLLVRALFPVFSLAGAYYGSRLHAGCGPESE